MRYQHTDALGSPVAVTLADKFIASRSAYTPYGIPLTPVDGVGYTGHVMDVGTGLTYMQQRYYDPGIGRFLSVDPIRTRANTGANFNRYLYAENNPLSLIDRDGRAPTYALNRPPSEPFNGVVTNGRDGWELHLGDADALGPIVRGAISEHELGHLHRHRRDCSASKTCDLAVGAEAGQTLAIVEEELAALDEVIGYGTEIAILEEALKSRRVRDDPTTRQNIEYRLNDMQTKRRDKLAEAERILAEKRERARREAEAERRSAPPAPTNEESKR